MNIKSIFLSFFLISFCFFNISFGQNYYDVIQNEKINNNDFIKKTKNDYFQKIIKNIKNPRKREKALNDLMTLAWEGDARAKRKIGEIFIYGQYGFKRDCKKGLVFLFSALNTKENNKIHSYDPLALKTIALMFKDGICLKKNKKKYKKYIEKYFQKKINNQNQTLKKY